MPDSRRQIYHIFALYLRRDAEIAELKLSHGPAEVTQWAFLDRSTNVGKMWENLKENPSQNALRGVFCGATGNRTRDTRIFSPLLYQLSYGTRFCLELPYLSIGIAKVDIIF